MSQDDDDARLVAWIDGELDDSARAEIGARLADEEPLRERLSLLRGGNRPFATAFDALLVAAPIERLQSRLAALGEDPHPSAAPRLRSIFSAPRLAAAAAIVLFVLGVAVGRYAPDFSARAPERNESAGEPQEDWRQAVVEYMSLYTPDTFASETAPPAAQLAALGSKIGLPLTPERVELADLQLKGALIFSYDGAPLGQISYLDPATGPVLFCVIRDQELDAGMKTQKRGEFAMASWARAGRGYMLIGRLPVGKTARLANSLAARF